MYIYNNTYKINIYICIYIIILIKYIYIYIYIYIFSMQNMLNYRMNYFVKKKIVKD